MPERANSIVASLLIAWVAALTRRPVATVLLVAVLAAAAGAWAASTLRLQADVTGLVDAESDFLRDYDAYKAAYPQHRRLNVIVIDGDDARRARRAEAALLDALRARPDLFPRVAAPGADPFLRRHALLYLETDALADLIDDLATAQPALALLARDPSLRGLAALFGRSAEDPGEALGRLAGVVAATAGDAARGAGAPPSWAEAILGEDAAPRRRLIVFQGSLADDDGALARRQEAAVRALVDAHALVPANGVRVTMTGRGPLSQSELASAIESIQIAGLLSLAFVAALLWIGLGSLRAILAAVLTLAAGLAFTAAFAALAVGSLNVLSLTFAVLFIGLGIDFAIHMILRRVGEAGGGDRWSPVLRGLGPTISLCGLTTAIAFLSFWPTGFRGLAELGLISAGGMAIAVIMTFTMLPPLLELLGAPRAAPRRMRRIARIMSPGRAAARAARPVSVLALALFVGAAALASQVRFDFNSLNLQNPESEAVRALVSLHADGTITPYSLTVSVPDLESADRAAGILRALPEVGRVRTLRDFVPAEQEVRLAMLDEARILLGPVVLSGAPSPPPDAAARLAALASLADRAAAFAARSGDPAYARMAAALRAISAAPGAAGLAERLEALVAADFIDSLALLRTALTAGPVRLETLPAAIVARETGRDGALRVVALPRDDLRDFAALGAFVRAVQAEFPAATGRPALEAGVGEIVVTAFRQAFAASALAIFLVLALALRSPGDALLVMAAPGLAASLTAAAMVLLGIPLNVANVIVLPLLLGMGVDNGLHIVGRYRESGSVADVYRSTTPRAVAVSVLTTLLSFVALAFADHRGMASMGQLLAVAIGFMLFATLFVLPALLAWRGRSRPTRVPAGPTAP